MEIDQKKYFLTTLSLKLQHKILEKEDVAFIFSVSPKTIERMMADGSIPFHYVGNKPRFHLDEIVAAFRKDCLGFYQRQFREKQKTQERLNASLPSKIKSSGPKTLAEIR